MSPHRDHFARAGRRALATGALLSLGFVPAAGRAEVVPAAPSLELRADSWVLPGRPLEISVGQHGILEGRRLAVYLFVDENQFDRLTTQGGETRARVALPDLAPGEHRLTLRSGTETAEATFRILSWGEVALWTAGPLTALLFVFAWRRRARLSAASG